MFNNILVFASALSALVNVGFAVPTTSSVPEVKPGPGLPSLASLNLTSADLYAKIPQAITARQFNYPPTCQTWSTAQVNDVIACFNYLMSIGNNACAVSGVNDVLCVSGTAEVGGTSLPDGSSTTSACYYAALAVQWVFTNCNTGGYVGGSTALSNDGSFIVTVNNVQGML